jgi:hypothetical protein
MAYRDDDNVGPLQPVENDLGIGRRGNAAEIRYVRAPTGLRMPNDQPQYGFDPPPDLQRALWRMIGYLP